IFLGDRDGVRTPMQWSPDRNAGFSRADPQRLYLPPIMDPIYGYETILCVANLSRSAQPVELNLSQFRGRVPVEMVGRTPFPPIGDLPYMLTLAAHGFYWFRLALDADVPHWHEEHIGRDDLPLVLRFDGWPSLSRDR